MAIKALPAPRKPIITLAALGDLIVPIAVLAIVMALIAPMPSPSSSTCSSSWTS